MSLQLKKRMQGKFSALNLFSLLFVLGAPIFFFVQGAEAANLQQAYIRLDRMKAGTPTTGLVCARPATTSATNVDVQVTFPTGFAVNTTASNWTTTTTNLPASTTIWPGITAATATISGQTVTWTYSGSQTLTAGTTYCFNWSNTAALSTSTAGASKTGSITTRTTAAATIDTGTYATAVLTGEDTVSVTATVAPTFTFTLSGSTDTFASPLSTTAQLSNGVTAQIVTNAASGWVVWVKSANAALNSLSTGATIPTLGTVDNATTALTAANYGYQLDATFTDSVNGTGTVSQGANYGQEYDGNSSDTGGTLSTTFQPLASSTGTTDGDTVVLKELARVTAFQPAAADYTDTLTVVAAGRF